MNINQLLTKYWDAETTIAEEQALKAYFLSEKVAAEHEQYRPLFSFLNAETTVTTDVQPIKQATVRPLRRWMSIAASLVVLIGASYAISTNMNKAADANAQVIVLDEEAEMQRAYETTKMAFAMLSSGMSKGKKKMNSGMSNLDEINIFQ